MKIKIKKATIKDLTLIQKLNHEVFEASLPYENYLDMNWSFNKKRNKYFKEALQVINIVVCWLMMTILQLVI